MFTHWAKVRGVCNVLADRRVSAAERHAEKQGVTRLLAQGALTMYEGQQQGEDQKPVQIGTLISINSMCIERSYFGASNASNMD